MRLRYRERRRALVEALEDFLPQVELSGVAAGLYALALLPPGVEEGAVLSAAAARRVGVEGLQGHSLSSPPSARAGLVLGFASLPEPAIRRGIELLAEAVEAG
jgi:GntR family transcriptional regulator/MocR family aminotransferase